MTRDDLQSSLHKVIFPMIQSENGSWTAIEAREDHRLTAKLCAAVVDEIERIIRVHPDRPHVTDSEGRMWMLDGSGEVA